MFAKKVKQVYERDWKKTNDATDDKNVEVKSGVDSSNTKKKTKSLTKHKLTKLNQLTQKCTTPTLIVLNASLDVTLP